jgi:hypothetical protein
VSIGDQTLVAGKIIIDINDYLYEWILTVKSMSRSRLQLKQKGQFRQFRTPTIDQPEKLMNPLETPSSRIRHASINTPAPHALACT